jgi:hypothetical protein
MPPMSTEDYRERAEAGDRLSELRADADDLVGRGRWFWAINVNWKVLFVAVGVVMLAFVATWWGH